MSATVPDTSVWIRFLREDAARAFVRRGLRVGTVFLSSVVAYELYLGATNQDDKRDLDRIQAAFHAAGLTIVPSFDNWCTAAVILERYRRMHGAVDPRLHVNDILIVLCAAELRGTLLTWNVADMARWNRMLPRTLRVHVASPGN